MIQRGLRMTCAAAGVLLASVIVGPLQPSNAGAQISICRTDPIVTFSNGQVATVFETINDPASALQGVYFKLHAPRGLQVKSITYDQFKAIEHLTIYYDQEPKTYVLYAVAYVSGRQTGDAAHLNVNRQDSQMETSVTGVGVTIDVSY